MEVVTFTHKEMGGPGIRRRRRYWKTYPGIVNLLFSPSDICGTPWSQPKVKLSTNDIRDGVGVVYLG
jgi:hypothetical protein